MYHKVCGLKTDNHALELHFASSASEFRNYCVILNISELNLHGDRGGKKTDLKTQNERGSYGLAFGAA